MMKKYLSIAVAFLLCLLMTVCVFAAEESVSRLYDEADLLTDAEESVLLNKLNRVSEAYQVEVAIAAVDTAGQFSADHYVEYFYDRYDYGYGENRDGVLLMVIMDERDYRILSNGLGADAISMSDIDSIGEEVASYLSDGDYVEAFDLFVDECEYEINGEINGFPFDYATNLIIALVVGVLVAVIVTTVMRAQLKTVRPRTRATEYTKPGSMRVDVSRDFFLYRTIRRVRRESSSGSGSRSGSSRNVGGGKF